MIASLHGRVTEKFGNAVIIETQGVGYEVILSAMNVGRLKPDDDVKLYTYHLVREQSEELFGFMSLAEKRLFELLITVQGVGPRSAMAILSLAEPEQVRNAIANADAKFVAKATGIGKKCSERVIVDLSEKVGPPSYYGRKTDPDGDGILGQLATRTDDEALEALIALGYQLGDAMRALEGIDPSLTTEERIRLALKERGR